MSDKITVTNERGQVASFTVDGPMDPRAQVLRQRIDRGELRLGDRSKDGVVDAGVALLEGVKDEEGNYLRSVHGGGIDPDAAGDARGIPSGSGADAAAGAKVAADALALLEKNADAAGVDLDPTTKAVKVTVDMQTEGARKAK